MEKIDTDVRNAVAVIEAINTIAQEQNEQVFNAIKTMQMAKRNAKIFPEGVTCQEVYTHLLSSGVNIGLWDIEQVFDTLKRHGRIRIYPTIHDKRAIVKDL